jgi:hypothetical protein
MLKCIFSVLNFILIFIISMYQLYFCVNTYLVLFFFLLCIQYFLWTSNLHFLLGMLWSCSLFTFNYLIIYNTLFLPIYLIFYIDFMWITSYSAHRCGCICTSFLKYHSWVSSYACKVILMTSAFWFLFNINHTNTHHYSFIFRICRMW